VIQGDLENVSLKGLLLRCETVLPEQTPCQVFLHLDGGQGGPTIEAQGLARRTDPQKLAIQFTELIDNESTHHLPNLLLYYSGTPVN
jgi:hypothetical protein